MKFNYSNQTTVIKSLLATKNLNTVFTCDTSWNLSKFSSRSIKFFSTMLNIISWCAIFNDYATHQSRRMIPYKVIIREMNNTSMLLIKKAYLHFLFYVFFMQYDNIERGIPENILEDIMMNIIVPDIAKYKLHVDNLIIISIKEMYDPIPLKKDSELSEKIKSPLIKEGKKKKISKIDSLTREQAESLEYWKYINSHKPDTVRISTGLLCVIKDITQEYKLADTISATIAQALNTIKSELQKLIDELFIKMHQCQDIDMSCMIYEVCITMLEIPFFIEDNEENSVNEKKADDEDYQHLLILLRKYIEENHIVFYDFIDQFLTYDNNTLTRYELIQLIKSKLKLDMQIKQIEAVCRHIETNNSPDADIAQLSSDLKSLIIGNTYIVRKERVPVIIPKVIGFEEISTKFKQHLLMVDKVNEENQNDIALMVSNVKSQIIDPALEKNDTTVMLKFIRNLSLAFHKTEHKIYLINILKDILQQEVDDIPESEEGSSPDSFKSVTIIQNIYTSETVIEICFSEFNKESPIDDIISALDLLCYLVSYNNINSKQQVLNYLKKNSFRVFSFIKGILREVQDILTDSGSTLSNIRKRTLNDRAVPQRRSRKNDKSIRLANKLLLFLQQCCDNCFLPFQEFLQVQNPENSLSNIDLVTEMSQFLIRLEGLQELKSQNSEKTLACLSAIQCIKTLADCCQGPCYLNQMLLGQSRRLYEFMNWLFTYDNPDFSKESVWLEIYTEGVDFLDALIEANTNLKVAKNFIREINLEMMSFHAALIWKQLVEGRERIVYQENKGKSLGIMFLEISGKHLEEFEKEVIDTGFNIYILLLTLQYMHPTECNLKLGSLNAKNSENSSGENLRPGFRELVRNRCRRLCKYPIHNSTKVDTAKAQNFYYSNIATVEINNREKLAKLFFRIPNMCRYMTNKSSTELIFKVNRASHQEKIEDFCNKSKIYEIEMRHQQEIARYPVLDAFISNWRFYGKLSYLTVISINIILLATVSHVQGNEGSWEFRSGIDNKALLTVIAAIQIILAGLVYICYLVEYLPVIKYKSGLKSKGSQTYKYHTPKFNRIKGTELMKEVLLRTESKTQATVSNFIATLEIVFFDFECVYNLIYFIISVLSWEWPLLYSVLLLDLVKRNNDLKNILRSITLNGKQLLLTTFLGVIFLYIFSIIAFLNFAAFYSNDLSSVSAITYCDTLVNCFISTSVVGIRQGGGIGDAISQPTIDDPKYWGLMFFNLFYFAIVINILLNIIFGIIIDTFGQLRDQNQAELKDIKENCFVCGNQRFLFEVKRISWGYHINIEHNPRAYLAFLIYIRHKRIDECSGAEKYVKEKLEKNETMFFPLTALSLIADEDDNVEKLDEVQEKVLRIAKLLTITSPKE